MAQNRHLYPDLPSRALPQGIIITPTKGLAANISFLKCGSVVADAQALPFPENHFTHTLMNSSIDAALVVKESFRVLKSVVSPPMFTHGPVATKESITNLLTAAGFTSVDVQPLKFEFTDDISLYLRYMKPNF
ncbi:hypothetical protein B0H13DRAFT_2333798 [Mycena leptocephala]|nr:hypothetical protein B0H13DRAFT_2333798 [Mycena leptocephala]